MGTTDICVRDDLHRELREMRDMLGLTSFSELLKLLRDAYLDAPQGVPADVFRQKRDKYMGSYPDEFRRATGMCIGITDPEEFNAAFEEAIRDLIMQSEASNMLVPEERLVMECPHCHHVWAYKGKKSLDLAARITQVHCPVCQATASRKWLRKLVVPGSEAQKQSGPSQV